MSDIFENDIDDESENLEALEDVADESDQGDADFTPDKPLYHLKLEYSRESIYATDGGVQGVKAGARVIVPTRYGRDVAVVLGETKKPRGVRQSDIVDIDRIVSKEDANRAEELKAKESEAVKVFKEKVAYHRLDMKLIQVHFLVAEQKALFFFS